MAVKGTRLSPFISPRHRRKEQPKVKKWDDLAKATDNFNRGVDAPRQNTDRGLLGQVEMGQFRIVSVEDEVLVCREWDGSVVGTQDINIAKPPELRTTFLSHGAVTFAYTDSVTRVASAAGESNETQVIVPSYEVNDVIFAVRRIRRGTGVKLGDAAVAVEWLDLNVGARAFAKQAA